MTRYLKVDEYAKKFRILRMTVYRLIKTGKIKYQQLGSRYILPVEEESSPVQTPVVPSKPVQPKTKSPVELLLDKISPEFMKTFSSPPEFGSVKIEVYYRIDSKRWQSGKIQFFIYH